MNFLGKYSLSESKNFNEYLNALGVNYFTRKMAANATPVTEIKQDGDEYIITTETTFKTTEIKFKLDQEFDEITGDGRKCKSRISLKNDKQLLHTQCCKGKETTIVREFEGDRMTMTLTADGVTCTRVYTQVRLPKNPDVSVIK